VCVADGFIEGCRRQGSLRFVVVFVGLAIYTWGCCSRCSQSLYGGRCWQLEGMADFSSTCMFLFGCLRVRRFAIFQMLLLFSGHKLLSWKGVTQSGFCNTLQITWIVPWVGWEDNLFEFWCRLIQVEKSVGLKPWLCLPPSEPTKFSSQLITLFVAVEHMCLSH